MTRKRFIKLMMAEGYSRNLAREIAKEKPADKTYSQSFKEWKALKSFSLEALTEAIQGITEKLLKFASAFGEGWRAFIDTFNDSLNRE